MTDRIITKTNSINKVVDFRDELIPSGKDAYAMLHGIGGGKHAVKSTIKVAICDFSKGKGQNSVTALASLTPDIIARLYDVAKEAVYPHQMSRGLVITESAAQSMDKARKLAAQAFKSLKGKQQAEAKDLMDQIAEIGSSIAAAMKGVKTETPDYGPDFNYSQDRVQVHRKKPDGTAPVDMVQISRNGVRSNGEQSKYPWNIRVTNGEAPITINPNGSTTYNGKALKKNREVFINVSDADMYKMMYRCVRYIETWENAICLEQVVTGYNQAQAERQQYAASKGGN